ncbi:phosphatidate phosphatase LPIN2 isoform X1 [Drosophila ananassae]|uniref:phosphatidate phosphatase LPIN2 isoform X1 n=1 Tax=Drosophila ananassae TaxID=7217 RepID=UPI0013A5CAA8|nr:phosphatidate phosphatase LPIN2 isoform X1 [Drosophila ananassae]XP_032307144.1 phosphatidate phosphatase LPIN2 isoform X1 [Drosophila ananassae]XP_032307145.1 phosphatidate phosphatase LPIN2 isoform X1 [Drosophila ananassae]
MNSLARVFSNFRDFYNDINAATLTGAIDVIVVEQKDGEFQCSPFHVRFGKLGVLRSREKVVDIEINGAPVDIQMKLGDSGEAFFVEECLDDEDEELPANLATSPIPNSFLQSRDKANDTMEDISGVAADKNASEDLPISLPLPRRNSIDFSKEEPKEAAVEGGKFENQVSDYTQRRHTDNTLERRNLGEKLKEYTTQKIRQEWAEHEELFQGEKKLTESGQELDSQSKSVTETEPEKEKEKEAAKVVAKEQPKLEVIMTPVTANSEATKDVSKSKTKKRRKKSQMKKNVQRKTSSSSSVGSAGGADLASGETPSLGVTNIDEGEAPLSSATNNNNTSSSNDEQPSAPLLTAHTGDDSPLSELPHTPTTNQRLDLDIHFFSDTEITSPVGGGVSGSGRAAGGRPSTPIQSDSELETTMRDKRHVSDDDNAASWKWGELPTPEQAKTEAMSAAEAQKSERHSMLSNMFSFMKRANQMRIVGNGEAGDIYLSDLDAGSMDPEMAALYFPTPKPKEVVQPEEDRESGNGTSLPHSPSSLEEGQKSIDSDFDESKQQPGGSKYLDFVALSTCGMPENGATPSDEEFDRNLVSYPDVCKSPSIFSSPNLVVRLNGKYYTWMAACPIVMTMITFQKPLTHDAIEQLMSQNVEGGKCDDKPEEAAAQADNAGQTKRYWWSWRRSQDAAPSHVANAHGIPQGKDEKDGDQAAVATQTSRPNSPDITDPTLSKSDSLANAENTSALVDNLEELTMASNKSDEPKERYKKSLRLSSAAIKKLNLKEGMNEIEFSVTTAYQGTTRCKCYLFRWKHNDKVVISDIDGTITKSDVLGHILPMVGKDWAQLGVAQLFSKIEQNGYKLLYLSARAIGQSRVTREYLRSIRQGNVMLPDGPLLLNPTSLISAFHREVIEKKPEQFKIACLSDIRDLFPDKEPFYAGYGNRINDVWAYRAVGIPIMRIFTINTKGELKHELTQTFQSSGYINQSLEVDEYFPLLTHHDDYDYRTDVYDDEESEEELQFSDDYDVDVEQDGSSGSSEDDDDNAVYNDDFYNDDGVQNDDTSDDEGLIMPVRRVSTKTEVVLASPPKWSNS